MDGHGVVARTSALTTRVLAPNPGPMSLEGTNSYIVRAPGAPRAVVVDPGPVDAAHLARLQDVRVELILLTHHHGDHAEAAPALAAATGAPVRAMDAALCLHAEPLSDGEQFIAGGVRFEVLHTPGHTADSVSFLLPDDAPSAGTAATGSVLTGDTILGRGTTVLAQADRALAAYLASLELLRARGAGVLMLPAHGPAHPDLRETATGYLEHRIQRIAELERTLADLGLAATTDAATVAAVVARIYPDIAPDIRFAAEASARAQLEYLAERRPTGG